MNQQAAAATFAKASVKLERAEDAYDLIRDAAAFARAGTPGPVHISLPDDILRKTVNRSGAHHNPTLTADEPDTAQPVAAIADQIESAVPVDIGDRVGRRKADRRDRCCRRAKGGKGIGSSIGWTR